jgi:hypothetical protein
MRDRSIGRLQNIRSRVSYAVIRGSPMLRLGTSREFSETNNGFPHRYQNGSILIASLSPTFTILHTLTTSNIAPAPITSLQWHASSSKQKADMLAVQNRDGNLLVWSVAKSMDSMEPARVVRILKKEGCNRRGNNWMAWSKNGRILQFSEGFVNFSANWNMVKMRYGLADRN